MTLLSLFVMELGGHYGGHVFPHRNILLGILSCILVLFKQDGCSMKIADETNAMLYCDLGNRR